MLKFQRPWQIGDTATAMSIAVLGDDGLRRADLDTATVRVVNLLLEDTDPDYVIVDDAACDQVSPGLFEYRFLAPEVADEATFSARLRCVTASSKVYLTPDIRGQIKVNA